MPWFSSPCWGRRDNVIIGIKTLSIVLLVSMLKKSWNPFMGLHNYCCPRAFKLLHEGKEYGLYLKNENLTNKTCFHKYTTECKNG